jgi:hypothetical protein
MLHLAKRGEVTNQFKKKAAKLEAAEARIAQLEAALHEICGESYEAHIIEIAENALGLTASETQAERKPCPWPNCVLGEGHSGNGHQWPIEPTSNLDHKPSGGA